MTPTDSSDDGPSLINRQRRVEVSGAVLRKFLKDLQHEITGGRPFSLCLVSDAVIRRYNKQYRGKDRPTDVLSFPADSERWAGDMMISAETAQRQARSLGHPVGAEFKVLALHGALHLVGYDHENPADRGRMGRVEKRWRAHFGLPGGLIERTRATAGSGRGAKASDGANALSNV